MMRYSKKLIFDYVNGNDISGYSIEELEDNPYFMMQVIDYTKDKRMYELCSDQVKNNYEFVKFMILTFKDDIPFIKKIADAYLKNAEEKERYELAIIMFNILGEESITYALIARVCYEKETLLIAGCKNATKNEQVLQTIGLGFSVVIEDYGDSEIILNYFAKLMLSDLFDRINLEEIAHERFAQIESLKEYGIHRFVIELISQYDQALAEYYASHWKAFDCLTKNIHWIEYYWNFYNNSSERQRYEILIEQVTKYMEENYSIYSFSIDQALCYWANKYHVLEQIKKYDRNGQYGQYYDSKFSLHDVESEDLLHFYRIGNIFASILESKKVEEPDEYVKPCINQGEIIRLN